MNHLVKFFCLSMLLMGNGLVLANIPGGGNGSGANVTLTDSGSTVTIGNGIISLLLTKSGATINQINYTYNNGGGTSTVQMLGGGFNGGQLYWELGGFGGGAFAYTLVSNPSANGGNYAEVSLLSSSATNGTMEVHFSLRRGDSGFYVTAIYNHRLVDGAYSMGEARDNIYSGSIFNWMSVDAARNRLMEVSGGATIGVFNAPAEVMLWTNGIYQGQYEDKYCYSADFGSQRVWGWSSVGAGGKNVGLWNVTASAEYYPGGPMKRELMEHIGTTILNMHNGSHYGGGTDGGFAAGEVWTKVFGPYFIYCNNITNTITATNQAAQALYGDALNQGTAEQTAWPYAWFTNAAYASSANRGTVTGQIAINDTGNTNASPAGLWVGLVKQPLTTTNVYDFQEWIKAYQYWVKTDGAGNFAISNIVADTNYTLYAFGPGAAGTFQSQSQTGGNTPNTIDLPSTQFSVTVTGSSTNNLPLVTWTPTRVGATVFEVGVPNRTGDKFRHGDDYWVGDLGPNPNAPSPIWSKHLQFPLEYPNGLNYVVGQSRWTTDWNYVQPVVTDDVGNFNPSTSTITFNLASTPSPGSLASFYMALSSDYQGPMIVQVNGNNIAGVNGYFPNYSNSGAQSDTTIRQGIHGLFSDIRINFTNTFLKAGQNTITLNMRKNGYFANHAMYDYIRLELSGYLPPPPASVSAYSGNNANLLSWPACPGATSYQIYRSTNSAIGFAAVANNVPGPVCGSGTNNATFLDTTAANGTTYYYQVKSVNPTGVSTNSSTSIGVTPSGGISVSIPAAPTGLAVTSSGHQSVSIAWSAVAGANFYSVWRSTVVNNGGGVSNILRTIILNNINTSTAYTDVSPTDGSIYGYFVTATSAAGTGAVSGTVYAKPVPVAPTSPPSSLVCSPSQGTNVLLDWSGVSGAIGYLLERASSLNGTYSLIGSITETVYTDYGAGSNNTYYYRVTAMNAGGVSGSSLTTTRPAAPAGLTAIAGGAQVSLSWSPTVGATGYILKRGTSLGNETFTVASGLTTTNYVDTGLTNGVLYYYVVMAMGSAANSGNSFEVNARPVVQDFVWTGSSSSTWDATSTNWLNAVVPATFYDGNRVFFYDTTKTNVIISGTVAPALVTFANTNINYFLSTGGSGISGTASLIKTNPGTLVLSGANGYSGGTTVAGGTLLLNNATANCIGSGAVSVVSGAVLGGSGIISGAVTVSSGGSLNSGNPFGTLTISNTLTLAPTATTTLQIQHSPLTNGTLKVTGTLFAGGSLNVINGAGGQAFIGDSFKLLDAPSISGSFAAVNLPALQTGLAWNTNAFTASGLLSVVVTARPVIASFSVTQSSVILSGNGGVANANFYLLSSASAEIPFSSWTPVATNQFDGSGNFSFTNAISQSGAQGFYALRIP